MKPYSEDLRLRILAAADRGAPREEVAKTFSVSVPTIKRWLKRRREEGQVVVLDSLRAHSTEKVRALVEAQGPQLLFLPSYPPDLTP
jgi:transposase